MNRTKRIQNILDKHFNETTIFVKDNSNLHEGHNNFDGTEETHIFVQINQTSNLSIF